MNGADFTNDDLIAIRKARLRGLRTVQYADRQVTYSSDAEMRQVEQDIQRSLGTSRPRSYRLIGSKGL